MIQRTIVLAIFLLFSLNLYAQSEITDLELGVLLAEKESNVILLDHSTVFTIQNDQNSRLIQRDKLLLKNRYAKDHQMIAIFQDQFRKIKEINVVVKDLSGKIIEKYNEKDFQDISADINSMASDARAEFLRIPHTNYPYIIEVDREVQYSGSLHFPKWIPQKEGMRLLNANFKVIDETEGNVRFSENRIDPVLIIQANSNTEYHWQVQDLPAYSYEPFNNTLEDYAPTVSTAPINFTMDGEDGNMSSWKKFGAWIEQLMADKNTLNPTFLTDLEAEVNQADVDEDKVRIIYNYLQNNSRYVSIQLGIGGWQPFESAYVQEKKYGDCKALSFYTKSLLEHFDIPSWYTLVNGGWKHASNSITENFPNAHFNHAILAVPLANDTIFLECTSQTNPFGYQGSFTGNRKALAIKDNGAELINTTTYTHVDNIENLIANIVLFEDGAATVNWEQTFNGLSIETKSFNQLYHQNDKKKNEWLRNNYPINNGTVDGFYLTPIVENEVPTAGFSVKLSKQKEATRMGNRLFIDPSKYLLEPFNKLTAENRTTPIRVVAGFQQIDTLNYQIPENFDIEKQLGDTNLTSDFGSYNRSFSVTENRIQILRHLTLNEGVYLESFYPEFKEFLNEVLKLDREKIVLVKK